MCTAISLHSKNHYFGRNLDLEYHYNETVVITPRKYCFRFRDAQTQKTHNAMIGMAIITDNFPLYYDATNEHGLSMAGLNFPGNAVYFPCKEGKVNIASFELIPWILGQCRNIHDAKEALSNLNITDTAFSEAFPTTPLHWMISDESKSIVVESTREGLLVTDNPIHVLTNNPPFPYHLQNIANYINITREEPNNRFSSKLDIKPFSRGMGGLGLPGDWSSPSRFVRTAFALTNSVCDDTEEGSISQFFHILDTAAQARGCAKVGKDYEITYYSSCCNTTKGIYYYKTYHNSRITGIHLHNANLNRSELYSYPLLTKQDICIVSQSFKDPGVDA